MTITSDSVREKLASEDFGERITAVNQMRALEPAIAFELLSIASADSNARVRYAAVSQLSGVGHHNKDSAAELLRDRLISDPEPDVQAAAADSIGALKFTQLFESLRAVYDATPEWLVKFSIIAALGELGEPKAFELLKEAMGSTNELVKTAAIGALGELGDERAIELLIPYATHPDWQTRHRVVQALNHFAQNATAQDVLQQMTQDDSEIVAQTAKTHLEQSNP
ncbi:MAG: HEAT repeat domain-containing protein [Cyanobacteria bacterium P01_D01_bin.128]